jgi:hypothetical protein
MRAVLFVVALSLLPTTAMALDLECSGFRPILDARKLERPEAPFCATTFGSFLDEFEFQRCRDEMTEYQSKLGRFARCLVSEQERSIQEFNEAVRTFNARATQ